MSDTPPSALPALVTGASRGLGAALALEIATTGRHVVAVARTTGALEELDDRIQAGGGSATLAPLDITDRGAMQHLCRSIHDRWGGVSLWAHTAVHAAPLTPTPMIEDRDWQKSWEINVDATRRLIAYVAPLLGTDGMALFFEDRRGGEAFFGAYGATKAAQGVLARGWRQETRRTGPRIVVQEPRPMATAVRARFHPGEDRAGLASATDEARRLLAEALAPAS